MTRKYFDEVSTIMLNNGIRNYNCGCKIIEILEKTSTVKENPLTRVLVETCKEHDEGLKKAVRDAKEASEQESPNTLLHCNLCGYEITSCCMLSPDFSLLSMMESSILSQRKHFKEKHGYKNPDPRFTMCTYCHKISEFDSEKQQWMDCNHTI